MVEPSGLLSQRCFHHSSRESVARCPSCDRFFCMECVSDHHGRLLCSGCLLTLQETTQEPQSRFFHRLMPPLRLGIGIFVAWLAFYLLAIGLLHVPTSIHDGSIWHEQTAR